MLNPKYQRYADRLRELIVEGNHVATLERTSEHTSARYIYDMVALQSWLTKVENILETVFGKDKPQFRRYTTLTARSIHTAGGMEGVIGVLTGALSDLENGFLAGQEFLIASEVFDSVLDQAKYLNDKGFKDAAAVLGRTILEDALKRLARANSVPDNTRASVINQALRQAGVYQQHQERLVQSRLDIGNDAAHGDFHKFTQENVREMIEDVERFLAFHFTN